MKILGINISHHGSSCLLEDGNIKFYLEDERICRIKGYCISYPAIDEVFESQRLPIYFLEEVLKHTNHIDYIVFSSFGRESNNIFTTDSGQEIEISDEVIIEQYLDRLQEGGVTWGKVIFEREYHHIYHAANGFYASGFDDAVALVMDAGGALYNYDDPDYFRELESIYSCDYKEGILKKWQHFGYTGSCPGREKELNISTESYFLHKEDNNVFSNTLSCGPLFNRMSYYLGFKWGPDAGKVMGMASYCKDSEINSGWWDEINWYTNDDGINVTSQNLSKYIVKKSPFPFKREDFDEESFSYKCKVAKKLQDETFKHTATLIKKAIEITGSKNLILTGGYFANCMNNYRYLKELPKGVKLYVDPIPNDAGTALGAAKFLYYELTKSQVKNPLTTLYLS